MILVLFPPVKTLVVKIQPIPLDLPVIRRMFFRTRSWNLRRKFRDLRSKISRKTLASTSFSRIIVTFRKGSFSTRKMGASTSDHTTRMKNPPLVVNALILVNVHVVAGGRMIGKSRRMWLMETGPNVRSECLKVDSKGGGGVWEYSVGFLWRVDTPYLGLAPFGKIPAPYILVGFWNLVHMFPPLSFSFKRGSKSFMCNRIKKGEDQRVKNVTLNRKNTEE